MAKLSRREFLKQTGLAGVSAGISASHIVLNLEHAAESTLPFGRAFNLSNVYSQPDSSSSVIGQLAPDGVHPIKASAVEDWYAVNDGFVVREAVQPIMPYLRPAVRKEDGAGFWAELVAPSSAIRGWCAAHAPIVERL